MSDVVRFLHPLNGAEDHPRFAKKIRVSPDEKVSVYDGLGALGFKNPRDVWCALQKAHPEVVGLTDNFRFPGQGQRDTPVTDRQGLSRIIMLLPGKLAANFRENISILLERYLNADVSLADDIYARASEKEALEDDKRVKSCQSTKDHMAAVKLFMDTPEKKAGPRVYAFINETENHAVSGMHTPAIRNLHNMKKSDSTRDYFTEEMSAGVDLMNIINKKNISKGIDPVKSITQLGRGMFDFFKENGVHEEAKIPVDRSFALENKRKREQYLTSRKALEGPPQRVLPITA